MSLEDLDDDERDAGRSTLWAQALAREIAERRDGLQRSALAALSPEGRSPDADIYAAVYAGQARILDWVLTTMKRNKED